MPNIEVITADTAVNVQLAGAPPKREDVWISPLEVFFSQNVIYPLFSDGRSVDDAVKQIEVLDVKEIDGQEAGCTLKAPFPTTEAVRWCPKLRDGEGKPILDSDGEERKGTEGLFTLDNRRLYALQRAAVSCYPRPCRIKVKVITDRYEVVRHLKKFRTRTNGFSISITEWNGTGRDNAKNFKVLRVWDWRSAVAQLDEGAGTSSSAVEAADSGNIGCWEYLDPEGVLRGPFSHWQMRQWFERKMLPPALRIRPYVPGGSAPKGGYANKSRSNEDFRPVPDVFADAPSPFAPGWSPRATNSEDQFQVCAECGRQRLEGWNARGNWYCSTCWRKWEAAK